MWDALAESAPKTSPRAERLLLMAHASFCRCPAASLRLNRSLQLQTPRWSLVVKCRQTHAMWWSCTRQALLLMICIWDSISHWCVHSEVTLHLRGKSCYIPAGKVDEVECTGEALPAAVVPATDVQCQH
jgi:hypothetical protein